MPRWKRPSLATRARPLAEERVLLPATAEQLEMLHAALDRFWNALDQAIASPPSQDWRWHFGTAVAEIGSNIMRYAYPEGNRPGSVLFHLRAYPDSVVAVFVDRGLPYEAPAEPLPQISTLADNLEEGGYGLPLAHAVLDAMSYSRTRRGINRWRLMKRF